MSTVSYCFKICQSVDKKITNERRASISNPVATDLSIQTPNQTGALIFGRRFSLSNMTFPNIKPLSQEQKDPALDPYA